MSKIEGLGHKVVAGSGICERCGGAGAGLGGCKEWGKELDYWVCQRCRVRGGKWSDGPAINFQTCREVMMRKVLK